MREETEGANDLGGTLLRERVQRLLQMVPGCSVLISVEADGGPTDPLDDVEHRVTLLLAHGIAENAAE